jgi:excisionase family DNA binding protein
MEHAEKKPSWTETPTPIPDRPVISVREAAKILGVNVKTLYAEIEAGRFPALRVGRVIRIPTNMLASLLQGRVAPVGGIHASKTRS